MKTAAAYVVVFFGGIIVASVGAVAHRGFPPIGVIACIVMVAFGAVFSRTWLGWGGIATFAGTWMLSTYVWALPGPGGSVLIAQDALGIAWLVGSTVMIVAASIVPSRVLVGADVAQ